LKSIISIFNASREILLELLGYFNSLLFDWYHQLRFGFYSEIRANVITEMKKTYPIRINQAPEFLQIVRYAFFIKSEFFQRILNNLVFEQYFFEQFYEDQLYPTNELLLHSLIRKHSKDVEFEEWLKLYMMKITQSG